MKKPYETRRQANGASFINDRCYLCYRGVELAKQGEMVNTTACVYDMFCETCKQFETIEDAERCSSCNSLHIAQNLENGLCDICNPEKDI